MVSGHTVTLALIANLGLAALAGAALGRVYFVTLWIGVRRLAQSRGAAAWMALGFLARLLLTFAVLLLVVRWQGWPGLVAALAGFLVARTVFVARIRAPVEQQRGARP